MEGSNGTEGISTWIHSYYIVIEKEFEKRYDNQLLDVFRYVFCRNSDLEIERKKVNKNYAISVGEITAYDCIVQEGIELLVKTKIHWHLEYSDWYASIFKE